MFIYVQLNSYKPNAESQIVAEYGCMSAMALKYALECTPWICAFLKLQGRTIQVRAPGIRGEMNYLLSISFRTMFLAREGHLENILSMSVSFSVTSSYCAWVRTSTLTAPLTCHETSFPAFPARIVPETKVFPSSNVSCFVTTPAAMGISRVWSLFPKPLHMTRRLYTVTRELKWRGVSVFKGAGSLSENGTFSPDGIISWDWCGKRVRVSR